MLPTEGAAHHDALHRLGHIQPGPTNGRGERHDSMLKEPTHQIIRPVPRQMIQNQEHV